MVFQYSHRNGRTLHVCPRFLTFKKCSWRFSWGEKIFLSKILLGQVLGQFLNCHMLYYNYSWYNIYLKNRRKHLVRFFIIQTIEGPENIACLRQLVWDLFLPNALALPPDHTHSPPLTTVTLVPDVFLLFTHQWFKAESQWYPSLEPSGAFYGALMTKILVYLY